MSRPLADALSKLLKSDNGLASSQFTVAQRCALEEFSRKTQAVRLITQGRGTVYRVFERAVAVAHLKQMRPMQSEDLSAALPLRATNLALYRIVRHPLVGAIVNAYDNAEKSGTSS